MLGKLSETYQSWKRTAKMMMHMPMDLSVINTGSTIGKNNFDYSYWGVNGYNLGAQPQTLYYDFELLKHYSGHIGKGANILIGIEEFKLLVDRYPNDAANFKYYFYLEGKQIHHFSNKKKKLLEAAPGLLLHNLIRQEIHLLIELSSRIWCKRENENPISAGTLEKDKAYAKACIRNWCNEFGWNLENCELTPDQKNNIQINLERLISMLQFCRVHSWKAYVVVMPFSPNLSKLMPENILDQCLWKPLEQIHDMGYPVINLYYENKFASYSLYRNSLVFNETGKRKFNMEMWRKLKMDTQKQEDGDKQIKRYRLRNGLYIPWISFGTGVIWKYTRNPYQCFKLLFRQVWDSIKHGRLNRELYGNLHICKILQEAYDVGYRMFDSGRIYGYSEKYIGKTVTGYQDTMVTTKCSAMDITRKYSPDDVRGNLSISLDHLKRDSADLYLLHWPEGDWLNYYRQIIKEYTSGNIKAFGACNLQIEHLEQIRSAGLELPMVMQTEIHPLNVRSEIRKYCQEHEIQLMAYAPAAHLDKEICNSKIMQKLVEKYEKTEVQIIMRWHYQHQVIPVVSTFHKTHMEENLDIFDFALLDDEMHAIDSLDKGLVLLDSHGIDDPKYIWNY